MLKCSRLSLPREDIESFPPLSLFLDRIFSCCEEGGGGGGEASEADVVAFCALFSGCQSVLFCRGPPPKSPPWHQGDIIIGLEFTVVVVIGGAGV